MRHLFTIVLSMGLLLTGCAEVIDLGNEQGPSQLFVFGRLTTGLDGNQIQIATTSKINTGQDPVVNARVVLVAEGGQREEYYHIGDGNYRLFNREIIGETGKEYYLEITLPNGTQYQSVPTIMPGRVGRDYLDFEPRYIETLLSRGGVLRRNMIDFKMRTEILNPDEPHYIKWNLIETWLFPERIRVRTNPFDPPQPWPPFCYITTDLEPQSVLLHNGKELKVDEIPWRTMTERRYDSTFSYGYFIQVVQSSLTADAYRYWRELDHVANASGSIFDEPLGPVRSNVFNVNDPDEQILGYFEVSHVDTIRMEVDDGDVPFILVEPCYFDPSREYCADCSLVRNSSRGRPYWLD